MKLTEIRNFKVNYDADVSPADLKGCDLAIIDPEAKICLHRDLDAFAEIQSPGTMLLTYLSPLEINPYRKFGDKKVVEIIKARKIPTLGTNPKWQTVIVNPAAKGWQELFLEMADATSPYVNG